MERNDLSNQILSYIPGIFKDKLNLRLLSSLNAIKFLELSCFIMPCEWYPSFYKLPVIC